MLKVEGIQAQYGDLIVLHRVSVEVGDRETVALLGANGAGKTTLLRVISRFHPASAGRVWWDGVNLLTCSGHDLPRLGIAHVPEGRGILQTMTVRENLELGAFVRQARAHRQESLDEMLTMFPILRERQDLRAGTLSGGEQQMLAIARALMLRPRLLILDEPSLGLAPRIQAQIFQVLAEIRHRGTAVLLVEQNLRQALAIAARGYVLEAGQIVLAGTSTELLRNDRVQSAYLGL